MVSMKKILFRTKPPFRDNPTMVDARLFGDSSGKSWFPSTDSLTHPLPARHLTRGPVLTLLVCRCLQGIEDTLGTVW